MSPKNRNIIIAAVSSLLLFNHFIFTPYLHRRETTRITTRTLDYWVANDIPASYKLWESLDKAPPVYGVLSYDILEVNIKKVDGQREANILAQITFTPGNLMSSGEWIFQLRQTKNGWKLISLSPFEKSEI